ncbi:hypothetical protein QPB21_004661 [Vibrio alginolyticus]|uniref:hypothetical protein n=1 Tax=Vibrio alginolyticus TaxID=663 RepID=UPI001ECDBFD0|nr:hypothetical protein [Vibrio alginolyticus]HCE4631219.1 hypothetical protein [Vibrio parahaemolyticus]EGR0722809.1 hypothetical protein [Vibrio alginolyticus]ELA7328102.1 hypothetical protein [Vibrio alginolyticus]ELB1642132.1 hypothetical protein [Vibrio alginolyticus]MCR9373498.1 hypothetical protein [Vibrio alginolyticus]
MKMTIIKDGKFSIPLYHGTTGAFVDSIKEHGLGGVDHLEKIGAKSLMQDLFDLAERQGWTDENWLKHRKLLEPLVIQERNQVYNFQHGGAYLTYSKELAKKYALDNPFGCEYLQYLRVFIQILLQRDVNEVKKYFDHPVFELWQKPNDPYLITLDQVELENVEPENDVNLETQIASIESQIKQGNYDAQSFKLINPVTNERLVITNLGHWNSTATELL